MRKKKPEKSKGELDREEREHEEFLKKNSKELESALKNYCEKFGLDYEPPFSSEEATEILKVAKQEEFAKLLKTFPNYSRLSEWEQINAKLIMKFELDKKLSLKDSAKIQEAIGRKLEGKKVKGSSDLTNPDLCKFKK